MGRPSLKSQLFSASGSGKSLPSTLQIAISCSSSCESANCPCSVFESDVSHSCRNS